MRCCAIVAVRNEQHHLARLLADFTGQGIDVVVIDNGSSDGSASVAQGFLGRGVLAIERLPWTGRFDLTAQLEKKREIIAGLDHDWVIHADADEWLHSPVAGESLIAGIARLSSQGFNVINFEEFVFLPAAGAPEPADPCARNLLTYYYFAPAPRRLMRAWRRDANLSNAAKGGHTLVGGPIRLAPENFVLRHYMVRSQQHALDKYEARAFADGDLAKGWHRTRRGLAGRLQLPGRAQLKSLAAWDDNDWDRSDPKPTHFWGWAGSG
jgi:glycosyltransferase involved in cell wall biosynthesis